MSCDSRTSFDNGEFFSCDDKIERIGDSLVGCAGKVDSIFKFLRWFRNQEQERPDMADEEFCAVVLNKHGIFVYLNTTYPSRVHEPHFSIGSGSQAARAAMFCGKSPAEAVSIAIKCDRNSGGKVRTFIL